ncbi:hypothetical protein bplSymb_SCF17501P001 [Bathymodiolus platifrons methanotrophic gill symbiont]|uniref:DUF11 domain-containing protein n=1 Tax=Bathymodiolus platifrons methanotrophic gill symbiont TaxID=113268 RepID=UPI000B41767A|nr:DUF11 domain-containing protein [Bathymodiolus platifrons methanotrophic gill symbiont]GAW87792.1 hypothetical protein bplSymb_SCF17501P001 [Bathymodiolus platifrons methanotrophic gill symbiont]
MFAQVAVSFMAMHDNTFIALDIGTNSNPLTCNTIADVPCAFDNFTPDGLPDTPFALLSEGESALTSITDPFNISAGAFSTHPVQAHAISGDPTAVWESRWYVVLDTGEWGNEYFFPVSSRQSDSADPTDVFVYNPISNGATIVVTCEARAPRHCTDTTTGLDKDSATILKGNFVRFRIPDGSGARFTTSDAGVPFYAVSTIDSNPDDAVFPNPGWEDADQQNMAFDWGYAGVPTFKLSTQILAGFAPHIDPTICAAGSPFICFEPEDSEDNPLGMGSPLWVMSTRIPGDVDTVIYVDHDGDPLTHRPGGGADDGAGNGYDKVFTLAPLERIKIFDEVDFDNTGTIVYTLDETRIAAAWGQDPDSSKSFNPYFDAGTYIPALPQFSMAKEVDEELVRPGAVLTYTFNATNTSRAAIGDLTMVDILPLPEGVVTYNAGTTEQYYVDLLTDGFLIADKPNPGDFPLLDPGIPLGPLDPGETTSVTFQVTVDADILPNIDPGDDCPDPQTAVINNATVSSLNDSFDDDALTCVYFIPGIDIEKLTEGVDADDPAAGDAPQINAGDPVKWTYIVTNTGELPLENIKAEVSQ